MNIKDSYLHGGTHVMKNIQFSIAASGTNQNKLVATITWAEEGSSDTELAIPISGATFGSQTKNTVFAAPNGSAGVPSFRALVADDIPNLGAGKITSGEFAAARLPLATNSAKGAVMLGVAKTSDADSAITDKKYWVKMNANGKLFVDIPWANNTHYTAVPILGGSTATSNATSDTANDATYLNIIENSAKSGGIQITGSGATTVKANGGVLTISSTNTWKAASSAQEGYVPKLASGGAELADPTNDYVLAFIYSSSGTLTPSWKKLPAKAYQNTWRGIQDNLTSSTNTTESLSAKQGYLLANGSARDSTKVLLDSGTAEQTIKSSISSLGIGVIQLWRANTGYSMIGFANGTTKTNLGMIGFSAANTLIFRDTSNTDYSIAHANNITDKAATITSSSTTLATIAGKNITAKLPTNAKDTAGIVAGPGAAGKVYISNSSGAPTWDTFDTTVTSGSSHLVTSGAVYTAIANNVASAVQYQGTITSEADMIALTGAGQGDFARVTTAFTFTDASGASVTAHVGDVVYLTNNTPGTAANWVVAHTEIDTDTWTAASTSAAGYVPKLATGGANLAAASTDYVLAFTSGTTSPSWLKLPANAYKNDNTTGIKLKTSTGAPGSTKITDTTLISVGSSTGLQIQGGTNKFLIGNGTNYIEVGVGHGLSTKNININDTNYALYTSASSLPTIKAPTGYGTANQILATNADANGLTWVDKPATNVTTSLYVGASNGTSTAAQSTNGNVYLILKEGSTYTRYNITGSGRASVTSDANGKITINSAGYSNFVKSGSGAAAGLVPSPSTTAGTGKFLCEDGTWKTPSYTTNTDEKVKQSETTTTDYRGVVLSYNTNAAANTGVAGTVTNQVYVSNNLTVQPSTGSISSNGTITAAGSGTFAGLISNNGDLIFNTTNHILWNSGSYHQRIFLTDDSTASTAVFTFQQSSDSGTNWSDLMTIKDDGNVVATKFNGYTLAGACAKAVTDSTSASAISTGSKLTTERDVYYGLPTINGGHSYTSSTTLFAPTSAGTSGQILVSNGSGAPGWATTENYTTTTIAAANYSLSNAEWTAVDTALPTTSGTYALYIDDGTSGSYAGIFALEGGAKEKIDEIPLHWATATTTTADSKRIYAAVKEGKLQLSSNNDSATTYNLTIKYKRII